MPKYLWYIWPFSALYNGPSSHPLLASESVCPGDLDTSQIAHSATVTCTGSFSSDTCTVTCEEGYDVAYGIGTALCDEGSWLHIPVCEKGSPSIGFHMNAAYLYVFIP